MSMLVQPRRAALTEAKAQFKQFYSPFDCIFGVFFPSHRYVFHSEPKSILLFLLNLKNKLTWVEVLPILKLFLANGALKGVCHCKKEVPP